MSFPMPAADSTPTIQAAIDAAAAAGGRYTLPAGGYRLASTGLGYRSDMRITLAGDLYNDHGPLVGTQYCLTNRTGARLRNVTITGAGGAIAGADTDAAGATRKGLGIVGVDGFTVVGVATRGPLTGFGMEVKNATGGHLSNLKLDSGVNRAGADGLHFFGACQRVAGSGIEVTSGDDALSFTCENSESTGATLERITLANLQLNSAAFSCIKIWTGTGTGAATIQDIQLSRITGRITQGPTGCPLIIQNAGVAQGCKVRRITITDADLDFGAATRDGPGAYLVDADDVTLRNVTLRGRRNGQFIRAVRCRNLLITGEVWDTIPGSPMTDLVQLEQCANWSVNLVVRSASGARLGVLVAASAGTDTIIRYLGMTG